MTVGLLLAAGAGERFGGPKALARDDDGTWYFTARRFAVDSMGDLSQHLTYALGDS